MMGGRHRDDNDRDNFHPRRDDKGFDRMNNGPRGDFERGGPMMHNNINDPNSNLKMNEQMMPLGMQPNLQPNLQANLQNNMQTNLLAGKSEAMGPNPFEKLGLNIGIQNLLQLPPDRFAEITKNMNSQSKEGPFTGSNLFLFLS